MNTYLKTVKGLPQSDYPYSAGIIAEGKFLFVSGQGPYDPTLGKFSRGTMAEQTQLTLECIRRVVEEAGASVEDIVSCRAYPISNGKLEGINNKIGAMQRMH